MDVAAVFNEIPYLQTLGIEVTGAEGGEATATVPFRDAHRSHPAGEVAHGGLAYSLADTAGGAAAVAVTGKVTPTVDMRIDYLEPATADLTAEATVVREGGSVAVVDIEVHDSDGHHVATARGVYKTGGQPAESPWNTSIPTEAEE
jgi:uncharacterized protein (TIGR00369 family)